MREFWKRELRHWFSPDVLQVILGSLYGVVVIAYGLTGVSDGVFLTLVAFGVALTALAWYSAAKTSKKAEKDEATLSDQGTLLQEIAENTRRTASQTVMNLSSESNDSIRARVSELVASVRAWDAGRSKYPGGNPGILPTDTPQIASRKHFENNLKSIRISQEQDDYYKGTFASQAIMLREEMCRRLGMDPTLVIDATGGSIGSVDLAISYRVLDAGPLDPEPAIRDLESLARKLPSGGGSTFLKLGPGVSVTDMVVKGNKGASDTFMDVGEGAVIENAEISDNQHKPPGEEKR